jgi:hypothetical protein
MSIECALLPPHFVVSVEGSLVIMVRCKSRIRPDFHECQHFLHGASSLELHQRCPDPLYSHRMFPLWGLSFSAKETQAAPSLSLRSLQGQGGEFDFEYPYTGGSKSPPFDKLRAGSVAKDATRVEQPRINSFDFLPRLLSLLYPLSAASPSPACPRVACPWPEPTQLLLCRS